jgi:beta-lactam-binding protein with PASTA domain
VSASEAAGHKGPDTTKTVEKTECTEPDTSYNDPDLIRMPSFQFKNLDSVKECLKAAGWNYTIKTVDENTYGEDTVMGQLPDADTDVDPEKMPGIQLTVSTGDPA